MQNHNHGLWMVIGCVLPLLLIFLLPAFGIRSNNTFLFFVLAMFACHFLMMGSHGQGHQHEDQNQDKDKKEEGHEGHEKKEGHAGHGGCH